MIEAAKVKRAILAANGAFLLAKMKASASLTKPAQIASTALMVAAEISNLYTKARLSSSADALATIQASNTLYGKVVLTPPSALPIISVSELFTMVKPLGIV